MSLEDCERQFSSLSREAFTLRKGQGLKVYRRLQQLYNRSKYETKPLEKALKDVFTDDAVLFGHHTRETKLKVAVTATSCSGGRTILLSNYNAKDVPSPTAGRKDAAVQYLRFRPNSPRDEIRTWEAYVNSRCTTEHCI